LRQDVDGREDGAFTFPLPAAGKVAVTRRISHVAGKRRRPMQSTLAFAPEPEDMEDLDLDSAILTFAPPPRTAYCDAQVKATLASELPNTLQAEAH